MSGLWDAIFDTILGPMAVFGLILLYLWWRKMVCEKCGGKITSVGASFAGEYIIHTAHCTQCKSELMVTDAGYLVAKFPGSRKAKVK